MVFAEEWEKAYQEMTHLSQWPWSDLVSYVMRYPKPLGTQYRVLELGCGAGANIPFFLSLGVEYWALEGSASVVSRLREHFPKLAQQLIVGDFTLPWEVTGPFDLVVDRSSITYCSTAEIRKVLKMVQDVLKPGGWLIGVDWFSTSHGAYVNSAPGPDEYTKIVYEGHLKNLGQTHFSDGEHLKELLADFDLKALEHKIIQPYWPPNAQVVASWKFAAQKAG